MSETTRDDRRITRARNAYVRRAGYGVCNEVRIDSTIADPKIEHQAYGVERRNADGTVRFFAGMTHTYPARGRERYRRAWTVLVVPPGHALAGGGK